MIPPLALYVHMPWCVSKCPYCDFNSHALRSALPTRDYLRALAHDLDIEARAADGRPVESIFIGGGTPSLFPGDAIEELLSDAAARLNIAADCEITMEANPGALEHDALAHYRRAGVNRLSLGVQSFDTQQLVRLGRIHGPDEARQAFSEARAAGFDNINLDLMYGLPDQTVDAAVDDVAQACLLGPEHVSHYQLTLEPNTVFHRSPPPLPDDDLCWEMQAATEAMLASNGYTRYEISALSQPGRECRHNLNYWRFGDYLAVGAGAHGKITGSDGRILRTLRPAHPRAYVEALAAPDFEPATEILDSARTAFEFMLNASRLTGGFGPETLGHVGDAAKIDLEAGFASGSASGLLRRRDDGGWVPTELGFRFLNDLQAIFLP